MKMKHNWAFALVAVAGALSNTAILQGRAEDAARQFKLGDQVIDETSGAA